MKKYILLLSLISFNVDSSDYKDSGLKDNGLRENYSYFDIMNLITINKHIDELNAKKPLQSLKGKLSEEELLNSTLLLKLYSIKWDILNHKFDQIFFNFDDLKRTIQSRLEEQSKLENIRLNEIEEEVKILNLRLDKIEEEVKQLALPKR